MNKKMYQKPGMEICQLDTKTMIANSTGDITTGGNTGIGIGEGEPPTSGSSRRSPYDGESDGNFWNE